MQDFEPPPRTGTMAWCKRCADWQVIIGLWEGFAVRCNGCRYARFFGLMEREAGQALTRHKNSHGGHSVALFRNGKLIKRLGGVQDTLPLGAGFALDDDGEVIPF